MNWKPIVKDIDLSLKQGEVLGLIGESGAGKSTIGLAMMGYCRPGCRISRGKINFKGIDIDSASEEEKTKIRGARIAYVAQSAAASFNPAHKIIEQHAEGPVRHGLMSHKDAVEQGVALYTRLLLPEPQIFGYRYPHQVSGGQLQRAMVAMAMSCKPEIIVFDEPTTALDVTTQIEVLAAIREVTRNLNTAAIYISHDLAVVAQMADRIMVLRYGELIEEGNAREMLANPKQKYTHDLLSVRKTIREQTPLPQAQEPLLQVKNVTACYTRGVEVIKNINLSIYQGHTVAVVGESGSGKSTLARVVTGLLPPVEGQVMFRGQALPPHLRCGTRTVCDMCK
jgi:peptide/nickel transport system ATP-binding protein